MIRIHKEGRLFLVVAAILFAGITFLIWWFSPLWSGIIGIALFAVFIFLASFFRNPKRIIPEQNNSIIYAPADGKVVVIEEAIESEYFKDKRIQISIFMSPLNVHVNRYPVSGVAEFVKYHPGKNMPAWEPKSSTENERSTTVINTKGKQVLVRQIAGAMARRIVHYTQANQAVQQGEDLGFIKFGSRVDLFLPLDAKIEVSIDEIVKGNRTKIAVLS